MQSGLIELCAVADLAPGNMRRFEIDGYDPLLLCNVDGIFRLVEDECTHAIASLADGRLEGTTIFCPMHGGSFDVCTGKALSLPCKQALRRFGTVVSDGMVYLMA